MRPTLNLTTVSTKEVPKEATQQAHSHLITLTSDWEEEIVTNRKWHHLQLAKESLQTILSSMDNLTITPVELVKLDHYPNSEFHNPSVLVLLSEDSQADKRSRKCLLQFKGVQINFKSWLLIKIVTLNVHLRMIWNNVSKIKTVQSAIYSLKLTH